MRKQIGSACTQVCRRVEEKELLFLPQQERIDSLPSHSGSSVVFHCSDLLFRRNYVPETRSAKDLFLEMTKNKKLY